MEDAVHRRECMITRWIDEEGWHKMDLEFTSVMKIVGPTWLDAGLLGTRAPMLLERISRPQRPRLVRKCTGRRQMWRPRLDHGTRTGWDGAQQDPCIEARAPHLPHFLRVWNCE